MRNFSAPGFSGGGVAPCGRPALPYTPERSGFPSGLRDSVNEVGAGSLAATGLVPSTVTTTLRDGPPFIVNVKVVVAVGVTCRLPRGVTAPTPGSIATPDGFSVCQTSSTGCPGVIDAGRASKETMRGGGPPARCASTVAESARTIRRGTARRMAYFPANSTASRSLSRQKYSWISPPGEPS